MRSFIIIAVAIALLGHYLEWNQHQVHLSHQYISTTSVSPVIRNAKTNNSSVAAKIEAIYASEAMQTQATAATLATKPKTQRRTKPLNLSVPMVSNRSNSPVFPKRKQMLDLQKLSNRKEAIVYNAELVFDAKEGASVKGGKVNIRIPFG